MQDERKLIGGEELRPVGCWEEGTGRIHYWPCLETGDFLLKPAEDRS